MFSSLPWLSTDKEPVSLLVGALRLENGQEGYIPYAQNNCNVLSVRFEYWKQSKMIKVPINIDKEKNMAMSADNEIFYDSDDNQKKENLKVRNEVQ